MIRGASGMTLWLMNLGTRTVAEHPSSNGRRFKFHGLEESLARTSLIGALQCNQPLSDLKHLT